MHFLILGGGINGAALARELAGRGADVTLVERWDLASGATSASSRLIHGGLRYLEYREFQLVREALGERTWLIAAAPHLVRPLELFIPLSHRFSGLWSATRRFFGSLKSASSPRGLWTVRAGLLLYDWYSRCSLLPSHRVFRRGRSAPDVPEVSSDYRWLCSYWDGQVPLAERLVIEMLADADRLARQQDRTLEVHTYCDVSREGDRIRFRRQGTDAPLNDVDSNNFDAIINATGAWVDLTLQRLEISSRRLMGGTKGSHILTDSPRLRELLGGRAIYAEADDGRVVFVLPLGNLSMVGTTDVPFEGDPREACTSDAERDYLLELLVRVFPQLELTEADICFQYSGVRPLPYKDWTVDNPGAVTRDHQVVTQDGFDPPLISLVGGKLTTCRALAHDAAEWLIQDCDLSLSHEWLNERRGQPSGKLAEGLGPGRHGPLPGGRGLNESNTAEQQRGRLRDMGLTAEQAQMHWDLFGMRACHVVETGLAARQSPTQQGSDVGQIAILPATRVSFAAAYYCVRHEWTETLSDLVERRLMLLYHQPLTRATLRALAGVLVDEAKLRADEVEATVDEYIADLRQRLHVVVADAVGR